MDIRNFIWFVKSLAVLTTYWYTVSLVKPLFVASIASLTLMMTSMSSTINLLQHMGILPTLGTCCNCSSPIGAYKSEGLYNYFRCSNCKKKQSLLQNTNTVAKESFLPQQLKKWKCTPIKLFDIIKVANDFCESSNFWKNLNVQKSESVCCLFFLFLSYDE